MWGVLLKNMIFRHRTHILRASIQIEAYANGEDTFNLNDFDHQQIDLTVSSRFPLRKGIHSRVLQS